MRGGQLEGINSRIKILKRMACGNFSIDDFFFNGFRIKAAFPGNS